MKELLYALGVENKFVCQMFFSTRECFLVCKSSPFLSDMWAICPGSISFQVAAKVNKPEKITLQILANKSEYRTSI